MTNVPDRIREFWKEIYVLFDKHFLMDVNNQDNWIAFWADANIIIQKYGEIPSIDLISAVSELISKCATWRKTDGTDK